MEMALEQNPGVEEQKKMMEKTKGEEGVMATWSTETGQAKPETYWFKPKPGSVIPKKRISVIRMMLVKLFGSASTSTSASVAGIGEAKRVYPGSADSGI